MYHIVIFETTNEVEVVPHNWVRDNVCMWPPYKYEDRVKAIKSMVKPGPSWTPFKIRIIFTRETYEEARQKLPEAELNTDLTDVDSPPVRRKRHIKRARFFDDSETEDEANFPLPAAPAMQINPIRKCTSRAGNYSQPQAREDAETMNCTSRAGNYSQPQAREDAETMNCTSRAGNYSQPQAREDAETMNCTSRAGNYSQPQAREDAETMNSSSHTGFSEAWIRKILANQEMIKEQMGTLVKLVYDLKKLSTTEDSPTLNTDCFPLSSFQQLQVMEGQLQQEDYKTAVINTLALRGGTTVKESVWRILSFLLSNDMARQMNWRGINGKAAFKDTSLKTIINAAVRRNRLTSTATDQEVENWIKRWLQLSADRDGGRRARQKN
ncbi:uncharacterized protein LOC113040936 isoform X2 [Carassius auratus]|uniref:Uncharacterized protein LOC113040936 isoform X2 n=1 Tax=Carassius auratus TaxID=7957 RepID=A0A6P6J3Z4_CARAU|nr:uncharacterized protein LOC113040936 isoform X2 [Carassius auratus]